MRIVFIGSPPFARSTFDALADRNLRPVALITAPDRRTGRGQKKAMNPLAERARAWGLPVLQPERASDPAFLAEFAALEPDLGLVVSYGQILRQEFLDIPREGCVNLHGSLLPRWRGASPVQAAILAGDEVTGVSLQRVVLELDAGPVLAHRECTIGARETAPELFERIALLGADLVCDFLEEVGDGPLPAGQAQDDEAATHCRKIKREQARIDWNKSAVDVDRHVRAMAGWPMADTTMPDGATLRVLSGAPAGAANAEPGTIVSLDPDWEVACGEGAYRIGSVQRAGKAPADAAAFLRGARLECGDRLGSAEASA